MTPSWPALLPATHGCVVDAIAPLVRLSKPLRAGFGNCLVLLTSNSAVSMLRKQIFSDQDPDESHAGFPRYFLPDPFTFGIQGRPAAFEMLSRIGFITTGTSLS